MALENSVQKLIWKGLGGICTLFRLNTGKGWISAKGPRGVHRYDNGNVLIEAARPVALGFGLTNGEPVTGACDLPGWTEVVITPEMVGKTVAVFTSVEAKRTEGGRSGKDQLNWQKQVSNAGGIALIVNSPEAAKKGIAEYIAKLKQPTLL